MYFGAALTLLSLTRPEMEETVAGMEIDWNQAACSGATDELFFDDDQIDAARRLCLSCPLRSSCLSYALDGNEEFGVWGGLSATERTYIDKAKVPKSQLVVVGCRQCDEPVTFRLSPIPIEGCNPVSGRFQLADGLITVDRRDLRRPVRDEAVTCNAGHTVGWVEPTSMLAGLELSLVEIRSTRIAARTMAA